MQEESIGACLRQAREHKGWTLAEVSAQLRLPVAIAMAIEEGDLARLGAPVYVRGYLARYARLLDVPLAAVEAALAAHVVPLPPLKTAVSTSRSRYLMDRYARRMVYAVLTASILLPVVWLATNNRLPDGRAILTPLDAAPVSSVSNPDSAPSAAPAESNVEAIPSAPLSANSPENYPVVASLAPFYPGNRMLSPGPENNPVDGLAAPEMAVSPISAAPGSARISFRFVDASWVEILDHQGTRLAHGLIAAGETREFPIADVAHIALGNADGVQVQIGGATIDLSPFKRANVARFALSSDGKPIAGG